MRGTPIAVLAALLLSATPALPHSGGLDKYGCHHNRKTGDYHCHKGSSAVPPGRVAPASPPTPPVAGTYGPFNAALVRVIDGDTLELDVATWPGETHRVKVRLDGVDTPEMSSRSKCEKDAAQAATEFVRQWVDGKVLTVSDVQYGKFAGRVVGHVAGDGADLMAALIKAGHGRPYDGGKRQTWF